LVVALTADLAIGAFEDIFLCVKGAAAAMTYWWNWAMAVFY
jgi:hypothetical protein